MFDAAEQLAPLPLVDDGERGCKGIGGGPVDGNDPRGHAIRQAQARSRIDDVRVAYAADLDELRGGS